MYYQPVIFEISKIDIIKIKEDVNSQIAKYIKKYLAIDINLGSLNSSILLQDEYQSSIGISKVNEFINFSFIKNSELFCFVILDFDILTIESQNSLLKVLEEPKENILFILFTSNLNKVLDTIKSRCQIFICKHGINKDLVEKEMFIQNIEKYLELNYIDRYSYLNEIFLNNSNINLNVFIENFIDYLLKYKFFLFSTNNFKCITELIDLANHVVDNQSSLVLYLKYFNFLVFSLNI